MMEEAVRFLKANVSRLPGHTSFSVYHHLVIFTYRNQELTRLSCNEGRYSFLEWLSLSPDKSFLQEVFIQDLDDIYLYVQAKIEAVESKNLVLV